MSQPMGPRRANIPAPHWSNFFITITIKAIRAAIPAISSPIGLAARATFHAHVATVTTPNTPANVPNQE